MLTLPKWFLVPLVTLLLSWSFDRLNVEHRLTAVEAAYRDIQGRLDRIEGKVDTLVQRGQDAR